jgi:uncharacterized membrane protein HdeD (DUF308 family)
MSDVMRMPGRAAFWARERDPWALIVLGILAVLAGAFAIIYPLAAGVAATSVLGIIIIIAAMAHLVHTISAPKGTWSVVVGLVVSVLFAAAGLFLLARPVVGLFFLTVYLGVLYVVMGLFGLAQSLEAVGRPGWGWWLVGSLVTLVLGLWVLAKLPATLFWFLGLLVGVELIFFGVHLITLGVAAHGRGHAGMTPAPQA